MTELEIIRCLSEQPALPPLQISVEGVGVRQADGSILDALLTACWQGTNCRFGVECKSRSTPKSFQAALNKMRLWRDTSLLPMVVLPYLSDEHLSQLEQAQVSGLDLCGNGVIIVPGRLLVYRAGKPNLFRESAPIKNVYRGTSSIVGRVFLARPAYDSVNAVETEIKKRNGKAALSTISKVLRQMEEDVLIGRDKSGIRLLQPEKLLAKLAENYRPPEYRQTLNYRLTQNFDELEFITKIYSNALAEHLPLVATGGWSSKFYSVSAREPVYSFYSPNIHRTLFSAGGEDALPVERAFRFAQLEMKETDADFVYFDRRRFDDVGTFTARSLGYQNFLPFDLAASPVQTYLELMQGDERDRQTAEQVRERILDEVRGAQDVPV